MSANDGGPAFPESASGPYPNGEIVMGRPGMSLRDWFAGQALAGLLASGHFTTPQDESEIAWMTTHEDPWDDETGEAIHKGRYRFDFPEAAWKCADAMISYKQKEDK